MSREYGGTYLGFCLSVFVLLQVTLTYLIVCLHGYVPEKILDVLCLWIRIGN